MIESGPVVVIQDLQVKQTDVTVLQHISFQMQKGELVYLIGPTGSGKSSLLKTLYADLQLQKSCGTAKVVGYDLQGIAKADVALLRRKLGIIFQDFQLFFDRTVAENLEFVMRATGWTDKAKMKQRQAEVLMEVGLGAVGNKMPHQLSGGEQQRVVIARALINEPRLLIADEPTGNLDATASRQIMKIFAEVSRKGTAVLMATHNLWLIKEFPGRVLEVKDGTLKVDVILPEKF